MWHLAEVRCYNGTKQWAVPLHDAACLQLLLLFVPPPFPGCQARAYQSMASAALYLMLPWEPVTVDVGVMVRHAAVKASKLLV